VGPPAAVQTAVQTSQAEPLFHESILRAPKTPLLERLLALAPAAVALQSSLPPAAAKPAPAESLASASGPCHGMQEEVQAIVSSSNIPSP